jgi:hypothetical protein
MSEATWLDSREQAAADSDGGAAGNGVAEASRAVPREARAAVGDGTEAPLGGGARSRGSLEGGGEVIFSIWPSYSAVVCTCSSGPHGAGSG